MLLFLFLSFIWEFVMGSCLQESCPQICAWHAGKKEKKLENDVIDEQMTKLMPLLS